MNPNLTDVVRSHSFPVAVVDPATGTTRVETVVLTGNDGMGRRLGYTRNGECFIADGGLRWSRFEEGDEEEVVRSQAPTPSKPPDPYFEVQLADGGTVRVRSVGYDEEGSNTARRVYVDEAGKVYLQALKGQGVVPATSEGR